MEIREKKKQTKKPVIVVGINHNLFLSRIDFEMHLPKKDCGLYRELSLFLSVLSSKEIVLLY